MHATNHIAHATQATHVLRSRALRRLRTKKNAGSPRKKWDASAKDNLKKFISMSIHTSGWSRRHDLRSSVSRDLAIPAIFLFSFIVPFQPKTNFVNARMHGLWTHIYTNAKLVRVLLACIEATWICFACSFFAALCGRAGRFWECSRKSRRQPLATELLSQSSLAHKVSSGALVVEAWNTSSHVTTHCTWRNGAPSNVCLFAQFSWLALHVSPCSVTRESLNFKESKRSQKKNLTV
jgi:hypothetical protein